MTIYQDMFRKNDLEVEIFNRRGPIFFHQKCFLDHSGILSEKKTFQKSGSDPMDLPWSYSCSNDIGIILSETNLNDMSAWKWAVNDREIINWQVTMCCNWWCPVGDRKKFCWILLFVRFDEKLYLYKLPEKWHSNKQSEEMFSSWYSL
jgi:hypothetical protein